MEKGRSPFECEIPEMPDWMIDAFKKRKVILTVTRGLKPLKLMTMRPKTAL